jgi:aryl-alcohol dehydrogenase-like predicted oxidoreductase
MEYRQLGNSEICLGSMTWGKSRFRHIAEANGFPRVLPQQNEYSLMYRTHESS